MKRLFKKIQCLYLYFFCERTEIVQVDICLQKLISDELRMPQQAWFFILRSPEAEVVERKEQTRLTFGRRRDLFGSLSFPSAP